MKFLRLEFNINYFISIRIESWNEFHQHECTYLDLLNYSNTFHFQPKLALKLVLKHGIDNVLESFNKKPKDADHSSKKKNKKKNNKANQQKVDYSVMNYEAICSLQDQAANCPNFSPPITLILLFLIQRFKTLTMNEISILGCVLLRHLQQIHTNSKYILSKELKPETSNRHSDLLLLSDVKIGCALFQVSVCKIAQKLWHVFFWISFRIDFDRLFFLHFSYFFRHFH